MAILFRIVGVSSDNRRDTKYFESCVISVAAMMETVFDEI